MGFERFLGKKNWIYLFIFGVLRFPFFGLFFFKIKKNSRMKSDVYFG
ncbi:hypothetical protein LEP1GSC098_1426 [Leptospira interrogans serovar Grippotyphosa str. UI 08434]|nr:hypothetical protein LEP1GSC098_1426 [Leptospira interrogans serovar Grippotyphosa str. UI 08434]